MVGQPDAALFNAGMAALATAIEAQDLHPGDVILCGNNLYSETRKLISSFVYRGVRIVYIDMGDSEAVAQAIKKEHPRLVMLESVANAVDMRVCNIEKLVTVAEETNAQYHAEFTAPALLDKYLATRDYREKITLKERQAFLQDIADFREGSNPIVFRDFVKQLVQAGNLKRSEAIRETARLVSYITRNERDALSIIVDNTLSSPVLRNPLDEVGEHKVPVIVVESGTKHFQLGRDQITLGLAYTNDKSVLEEIKKKRTEMGTYLQPIAEALLPEDFTTRMQEVVRLQAAHALELAKLFEELPGVREVSHPNLISHEDTELSESLAPEGLVTVFYCKVDDPMGFVDVIKKEAGDAIEIGTSFGHEKTRLSPEPVKGLVRIAAGAEDTKAFENIIQSFKRACSNVQ